MERLTRANLDARCDNVNRRFESRGSGIRYALQGRNGGIGLDRVDSADPDRVLSTVMLGTTREVGDFLHAVMVGLDDAAQRPRHATDAGQTCHECGQEVTWLEHLPPLVAGGPVRCFVNKDAA